MIVLYVGQQQMKNKQFKCSQCYKTYPTAQCSKQIFKGEPVCKMCDNLFEGDVMEINDPDDGSWVGR